MAKQETGKNRSRSSSELIHCENCGEYYAATYRSCPFCEERPTRGRGGRTTNRRGGGYGSALSPRQIISYAASLLLIIAAVAIVASMLRSLLGRGEEARHPDNSAPPASQPVETVPPTASLPPETPVPTTAPVVVSPTALSLNKTDITLTAPNETAQLTATVAPADYSGALVWTSDNPAQVYVTQTGKVYAVSPGTVTVTVTAGNVSASCIVRNKTTGTPPADEPGTTPPADPAATTTPPAATSPEPSAPPAASPVTLNKSDFTIRTQDPATYQLKVSGGDGQSYAWVSDNTSVATVSETGLVTKVGSGRCNITVTSGGQSATCIVRVE